VVSLKEREALAEGWCPKYRVMGDKGGEDAPLSSEAFARNARRGGDEGNGIWFGDEESVEDDRAGAVCGRLPADFREGRGDSAYALAVEDKSASGPPGEPGLEESRLATPPPSPGLVDLP